MLVLGQDSKLLAAPVKWFLSPLSFCPQIELTKLLEIPEDMWRAYDSIMLKLGLGLGLLLVVLDFAQMASFAFATATPPSLDGPADTVQKFQAIGMIGLDVSFQLMFWIVVGVLFAFFVLMAVSERIETYTFPRREDPTVQLLWSVVSLVVQLVTSIAVIPFIRVLVRAFDCVPSAGTSIPEWLAVAPDSITCFSGSHIAYACVAGFMLVVYFPLVLRLLLVGNDLSAIDLRLWAPWDWRGDDRSEAPTVHILSEAASVFGVAQAVAKLVASVVYVLLGTRYPEWSAVVVLILGVAVLAAGVLSPPYQYTLMNKVRTALDAGVVWT